MGRESSDPRRQFEDRQEDRREAKVAVDCAESRLLELLKTIVVVLIVYSQVYSKDVDVLRLAWYNAEWWVG